MNKIKNGDFVILITDKKEFICEGILEEWLPNEEPFCRVDGKCYDLTNEGETIDVILKVQKQNNQ